MHDDTMTYTPLMEETTPEQLTLFQADFLASPSAAPENEKEMKMTARSGHRCLESFEKLNRPGLLVKTFLGCSQWTAGRYSTKYALRWKMKAIKRKRLLFQLVPSALRTGATGFGLLATPNTLDAIAPKTEKAVIRESTITRPNRTTFSNLRDQIFHGYLLPTPAARDHNGTNSEAHLSKGKGHRGRLPNFIKSPASGLNTGMKLQPAFVEWMMGLPDGWTDIERND